MTARPEFASRSFLPGIPRLLILLGGLLCAAPLAAQTPFALTNVGQKIDTEDARMAGRGGWGMAVYDSTNPGFKNTAGLAAVQQVAISRVGYGTGTKSQDAGGERTVNRVMTPEFRLAVPVVKGRLAVTAGFSMDRSFRYDTLTEYADSVRTDAISGVEQFLRQGTLFGVPVGLAWEAVPGLSLGATVSLVRGSITESLYEIFPEPLTSTGAPFYKTVLQVQKDTFLGTAQTWSVLYRLADRVSVGASWTPSYEVDADRNISLGGLAARSLSSWSMTMPDEYLLGGQANLAGRWWLGGDYQLQPFSEFTGPQKWLDEGMVDEYTISFGVERRIAYERRGGMNNWPLRLGFSTRQWAYRVGGNPVTENTYSLGTGFPLREKLGVLDLALSYSRIGDLAENGLEDSVWRMSLSVAGLENWW